MGRAAETASVAESAGAAEPPADGGRPNPLVVV
jgi:hypothetical protein